MKYALALCLLLSAAPARADYDRQRLAIELLVAADAVPGLVCVVHPGSRDKERINDSASLPLTVATTATKDTFALEPVPGADAGTFRASSQVDCPAHSSKLTAAQRAQCVLRQQGNANTCSASGCAPLIKLEENSASDMLVTCAEGVSGDPERVLLLKLQLPGDREGEVHGVSLDGTVVSIDGAWGTRRPSASVLGGHYHAASAASARFDNRMQLRIEARCTRRVLELPAVIRSGGHAPGQWLLEVDPDGSADSKHTISEQCQKTLCRASNSQTGPAATSCISNSFPVMLTRDPTGGRVVATLHLPANVGDEADPKIRLEARFGDEERPGPLRLQMYSARFDWLVRCEFHGKDDDDACPTADLIEAGISCKARRYRRSRCEYICNAPEGAAPFTLPISARFSANGQEDAWREQLTHVDQTLSGYTPLFERQFGIALKGQASSEDTFKQLCVESRPAGDQIEKLTIWTPSGLVYEFDPCVERADWPIVTVPGGRCGAPLTYRWKGSRSFDQASTKIDHGQIVIPHPDESAVRWSWGGLAAAALTQSLVASSELKQPAIDPALQIKLAARFHPVSSMARWSLDGGLTFLYSRTAAYPLQDPNIAHPVAGKVWSWRIGAELALMQHMPPWLSLKDGWGPGVLLGAGWRFPAYDRDSVPVDSHQFYLTLGAFLRAHVGGPLWLDLTAQYIGLERTRQFESTLVAGVRKTAWLTHTFLLSFGPRFWF